MTVAFVMLGEILIFLPSIANFRIQWLKGRIAQAEIAALAAEAEPEKAARPRRARKALPADEIVVSSTAAPAAAEDVEAKPKKAGWWQRRLGLG